MLLHSLAGFPRTIVSFAVVLGILVSVHEYGHYLAARLCNLHVEAFSIGFGRAIAHWTDRKGTKWQIGWLPLGGFVRLHGQQRLEDMTPEERAALRPGQGYHDASVARRAIVTIAGPLANFLLAMLLFTALIATIGQPVPTAVIGDISPNQAAARAGLHTGDRVLSIDGTPIATFLDIQHVVVANPNTLLHVTIKRGTTTETLDVTPDSHLTPTGGHIGMLGIRSAATEYHPVGPITAITAGATQTWDLVAQTAQGIWQVLTGQRGTGELGGVIMIAQVSGQAAALGIPTFIQFIALLSVNLGLLNLLPVPVLDGGHLVFYAVEAIRGRPLPQRVQDYGFRVGLGLILTLMILVNGRDLFRWVTQMIG